MTAEPTPRDVRETESHWRHVADQRPNWGWPDNPARRTINAAKAIERASEYGIPAQAAVEEYERARAAQVAP